MDQATDYPKDLNYSSEVFDRAAYRPGDLHVTAHHKQAAGDNSRHEHLARGDGDIALDALSYLSVATDRQLTAGRLVDALTHVKG